MLSILLILPTIFVLTNAMGLPPYIVPCKANDPDLNKCAVEHANNAIPHLLKGDAKYKIPSMLPFKISVVDVDGGKNFKLKMENIEIYGIDTAKIMNFELDPAKKELKIDLRADYLNVFGTYEINGKLLVLPLNGRGPANITLTHPILHYKQNWELIEKDGETYAHIKESEVKYDVEKVVYGFQNLFNGNDKLGEETNKVLNENWTAVHNDFSSPVSKSVLVIIDNILERFYTTIPYKYIFV